jgi:predicted hotdog family 3-hydroxylacyl-ACP dehydratase
MTRLGRDEILMLIPHGGAMCLLDEVLEWDAVSVLCLSHRYRASDNPLRRADGTLGSACGIEIAAQAMAVHGRLTAPAEGQPLHGYLVSLREVHLARPRLDEVSGSMTISATRLMGDTRGATYSFSVTNQGIDMLSGRATVLFGTPA